MRDVMGVTESQMDGAEFVKSEGLDHLPVVIKVYNGGYLDVSPILDTIDRVRSVR